MTAAAQKSTEAYMDRFGKMIAPGPNAVYKTREGIFAICLTNGHMLVTWSKVTPTVAELPGGGIEKGEGLIPALTREIEEETTAQMAVPQPKKELVQDVKYFSDKSEEFWDYRQTYWLLEGAEIDAAWFDGERRPEDALLARWVPVDQLKELTFHAMHRKALAQFGITW